MIYAKMFCIGASVVVPLAWLLGAVLERGRRWRNEQAE